MSKRILFTRDAKFTVTTKYDDNGGKAVGSTLSGYAMVWGSLSDDRGGYKVRLLPNSATPTTNVFALYHHNFEKPLARTDNGTLRITFDDIGAKVEIDLPDTTAGRDVATEVAAGLTKGMSFAMLPGGKYTESEENGQSVLSFSAFEFDEVTVTPIPAFEDTSIEVADDTAEEKMQLSRDQTKEDAGDWSKVEMYRLNLYAMTLAEIDAGANENRGK